MGLENFERDSCGFGVEVKRREAMYEAEKEGRRYGYGSCYCHTKREGHFRNCKIVKDNQSLK